MPVTGRTTLSSDLDHLHGVIEEMGIDVTKMGIDDEEDLLAFCARYVASNADEAFEQLLEGEE